jgi:diacylglycerol kinase family enzyme
VLWNSAAGWEAGEQQAQAVREILHEIDPQLGFSNIDKGQDIARQCKECLQKGTQVLIAAGGDGTINAVASAIVNTPVALGVIPAGTLNHFARDLHIAIDPLEAARQLRTAREVCVDVGSVNGRIFINNSVLGFYPVYRAAKDAYEPRGLGSNRLGRFFAALGGTLRVFWRLPHVTLHFVIDGQTHKMQTAFVLVANNEHELEEWRIGRRHSMQEGYLWIYVMGRCSRWALLRFFISFVFGKFSRQDAFEVFKTRELCIEARRQKISVGVDAEIVKLNTPLEYRSIPLGLRVIAPADYKSGAALEEETSCEK